MRCEYWRRIQRAQQTACESAGAAPSTYVVTLEESVEEELFQCGAACPERDIAVLGQKPARGVCDQLNLILRRGR